MAGLKDSVLAAGMLKGPACTFGRLTVTLPKDDLKDLAELLADCTITAAQIKRGLASIGVKMSASTVSRHRLGDCACV